MSYSSKLVILRVTMVLYVELYEIDKIIKSNTKMP